MHKISDEFEFRPDRTTDYVVSWIAGPKTFRTLGIFRTQDDSDPNQRRFGPKIEEVSDPEFRPHLVIIKYLLLLIRFLLVFENVATLPSINRTWR